MGSLDPDRIRTLLVKAKTDPDALLELQEMLQGRYERIIRGELRRRVPEYNDASGDAADIWGSVFLELLARGKGAEDIFKWLKTVLNRELKKRVGQLLELKSVKQAGKAGKRIPLLDLQDLRANPTSVELTVLDDIDVVLSMLTEGRVREGAELYLLNGEDYREIAEATGVTEVNARKIVSRGRRALKALAQIAPGQNPKWDKVRERLLKRMGKRL
jgi:DNA-directed RNA polymerase specialized sigma24 family protein